MEVLPHFAEFSETKIVQIQLDCGTESAAPIIYAPPQWTAEEEAALIEGVRK